MQVERCTWRGADLLKKILEIDVRLVCVALKTRASKPRWTTSTPGQFASHIHVLTPQVSFAEKNAGLYKTREIYGHDVRKEASPLGRARTSASRPEHVAMCVHVEDKNAGAWRGIALSMGAGLL